MQRCVDANNRVVDPKFCENLPPATTQHSGGGGGGFIPYMGYHFLYGGSGSYTPGSVVSGGSATPISGHSYSTTTGTARGGFGSSFGGGEGGGHGGGGGE